MLDRKFNYEIVFCNEILPRLAYLHTRVRFNHLPVMPCFHKVDAPSWKQLTELESLTDELTSDLKEMVTNVRTIRRNLIKTFLMREVLIKTAAMTYGPDLKMLPRKLSKIEAGQQNLVNIRLLAGVVKTVRLEAFWRMAWRVSRGNIVFRTKQIVGPVELPDSKERVYLTVFHIAMHGVELEQRILKVCHGFHCLTFECPRSMEQRAHLIITCEAHILETRDLFAEARKQKKKLLVSVAKNLSSWMIQVEKAKAIYSVMNLFNRDTLSDCLIGEFWVPESNIEAVTAAVKRGFKRSTGIIEPIVRLVPIEEEPPTYFKQNRFTKGFQSLVNAYGVSAEL